MVASPIGNLSDLSSRAIQALSECDFVLAEDTRVTSKLLSHLGVKKTIIRADEHVSKHKISEALKRVEEGETAVLITDAGTPCISDPGAELVSGAYERGIPVSAIPGPSAVTTALALSGFYAQQFAFLGYLPRKAGAAKKVLEPFIESTMTLVLFEAPQRVGKTLKVLYEVLGERQAVLCREMTKIHEEVIRGNLSTLSSSLLTHKGEFTIVVEGRRKSSQIEIDLC